MLYNVSTLKQKRCSCRRNSERTSVTVILSIIRPTRPRLIESVSQYIVSCTSSSRRRIDVARVNLKPTLVSLVPISIFTKKLFAFTPTLRLGLELYLLKSCFPQPTSPVRQPLRIHAPHTARSPHRSARPGHPPRRHSQAHALLPAAPRRRNPRNTGAQLTYQLRSRTRCPARLRRRTLSGARY